MRGPDRTNCRKTRNVFGIENYIASNCANVARTKNAANFPTAQIIHKRKIAQNAQH